MAKPGGKAHEKERKTEDLFHTDHDLNLREYVRFKRFYGRGDRSLSLDVYEYFAKLDAIRDECKTFGIEGKLISDALDTEYDVSFHHQGIDLACEELALQLLGNLV